MVRINLITPLTDDKEWQRQNAVMLDAIKKYTEKKMNEPINTCPNCSANLDGDLIWQTFMDKYQDEAKADEFAEMFGATRTEGRWKRQVGIYSQERDRVVAWVCLDCEHQWERT